MNQENVVDIILRGEDKYTTYHQERYSNENMWEILRNNKEFTNFNWVHSAQEHKYSHQEKKRSTGNLLPTMIHVCNGK